MTVAYCSLVHRLIFLHSVGKIYRLLSFILQMTAATHNTGPYKKVIGVTSEERHTILDQFDW